MSPIRFNSEFLLMSIGRSIAFSLLRYFAMKNWSPSPYINRFLSADTIVPGYANPQNLNRYSYVNNNPLRYTDPTGHRCVEDGFEGSCNSVEVKKTKIYKDEIQKKRHEDKLRAELKSLSPSGAACSGANQSVLCSPTSEVQQQTQLCLQNPFACPHPEAETAVYPVKQQFQWGAVDWVDVGINVVGIAGDAGLVSTVFGNPVGPEAWLVTEGIETVGIMRDAYKGDYKALSQDGAGKALEIVGDLRHSAILIPAVGLAFNINNIREAFLEGYVDVPDYGP